MISGEHLNEITYRNSHRVFKNFAKLTEKLVSSLFFNKVVGQLTTLLNRRPRHRYFHANFEKFLGTLLFIEHLRETASVFTLMEIFNKTTLNLQGLSIVTNIL